MKTFGVIFMAFAISATSLLAQDTDAQIKALEKELRLLELQKQVEQAKQGEIQGANTQNTQQSQQIQAQDSKSACGNDYTFTACYFGVELGVTVGSSVQLSRNNITEKYSGVAVSSGGNSNGGGASYLAMSVQLIGGYQWYFSDIMGVGINALLGYGGSFAKGGGKLTGGGGFSYTAITWGADAQYLLEFTRIVGMSAGLGFEMTHFIYAKGGDSTTNGGGISSSTYSPAFTAGIGIHFNTDNLKHRFGINYKYRLYKDKTINTGSNNAMKVLIKHGGAGLISFSYMYRF